jgi:hypothetical protein
MIAILHQTDRYEFMPVQLLANSLLQTFSTKIKKNQIFIPSNIQKWVS